MTNQDPKYRKKKVGGKAYAVVTLADAVGRRRDVCLGRYGTATSRKKYTQVLAEWKVANHRLADATGPTITDVILQFWPWAEKHYRRRDGSTTNELSDYRLSLRPLRHMYGGLKAAEFSPMKLKAVRQLLVDGYDHPRYGAQPPLSRGVINQRCARIVRMFKWAVAEELVAPSVHQALKAVSGLEAGRSDAYETSPVLPVSEAMVEATLPHLLPPVRAMVQVQQLTGARPGEVCVMRACDIDMSGPVWLYRPEIHKLSYRGKPRVIALGPKAQAIVREFLTLNTQAYLFSPREAVAHRHVTLRARRKSPVQPSQVNRKKRRPKRFAGDRYTTGTYLRAVRRACVLAFPPPPDLAKHVGETNATWFARLGEDGVERLRQWRRDHHWHVNQLRHSHGTVVRRQFGLEAAQDALGHANANVTQIYAERNLDLAVKVAAEIG